MLLWKLHSKLLWMDFRASMNFLKLDTKLHVFVLFFIPLGEMFVSLIGFSEGFGTPPKGLRTIVWWER